MGSSQSNINNIGEYVKDVLCTFSIKDNNKLDNLTGEVSTIRVDVGILNKIGKCGSGGGVIGFIFLRVVFSL